MKTDLLPASPAPAKPDYSLTGVNAALAVERGLAEADWYQCPLPRATLHELLVRRDGPALRDTALWFALILGSGAAALALRSSAWFVLPYAVYCVLYASTSDSRWHESGHGTAFRSDWLNNALYEIASFMVMRESVIWRWSHNRHHSDTIIVGRDPEIAVPVPPSIPTILGSFFNLGVYRRYLPRILLHAAGRMAAEEATFVPASETPGVYLRARIYVAIYLAVLLLSILLRSPLPLLFVGLPNLFGSWLLVTYGLTQHAGLAENVLDHRLNCRTVYMSRIHRYLYWNMNYHVEHHMFPLVPYHALPRLHQAIRDDCPAPYPGLIAAWREIVPTILRQLRDPGYHVRRRLPDPRPAAGPAGVTGQEVSAEGWADVCASAQLGAADVLRFDSGRRTYAVYRDSAHRLYATDGLCTHGNTHLSDGLVLGSTIECPKHNGRFHLPDGSPARPPVCRGLTTYPVEEVDGRIRINIQRPMGAGAREPERHELRVVGSRSVATFIREILLEPLSGRRLDFTPGDYLQIDIPGYDTIPFREMEIPEPYATVWRDQHVFDLVAHNPHGARRNNYSLASNPHGEPLLRLNVRIATPPPGQDCAPGAGSSYMFRLRPGDVVTGIGPFGDFHIRPTLREMLYIGGGAGMAPIRAHLSHLLETERTRRRVSYWYGARSRQEIYYEDYFNDLAGRHPNLSFHLALSSPLPGDRWSGHVGLIHQVVLEQYLRRHPNPCAVEYYLCGPPMMIRACTRMIEELGVAAHQIAFDEF